MKEGFKIYLSTLVKHKYLVGKYCMKVGLYKQGLLHDMSKLCLEELVEGAAYSTGKESPSMKLRRSIGYSKARLHHTGRNKHHYGYWVTPSGKAVDMPYKYCVEGVIDIMCASMVYTEQSGKEWSTDVFLDYWYNSPQGRVSRNMTIRTMEFYTESIQMIAMLGVEEAFRDDRYFKGIYYTLCKRLGV